METLAGLGEGEGYRDLFFGSWNFSTVDEKLIHSFPILLFTNVDYWIKDTDNKLFLSKDFGFGALFSLISVRKGRGEDSAKKKRFSHQPLSNTDADDANVVLLLRRPPCPGVRVLREPVVPPQ